MNLCFWSTIFMTGYGIREKIRLIPNTIFRLFIYYFARIIVRSPSRLPGLVARHSPEVLIKNKNGIFKCRKGSNDIWLTSVSYERELTGELDKFQAGIFVDVGANIGRYTIKIGRQIGNQGKVIAVEADPENYQTLLENIKLNKLENVYALNMACWDKEEDVNFFLSSADEKGGSSIKREVSGRVITVHGNTLDNILKGLGIEKVDVVKIDVEGSEKEVLLGMKDTVARSNNIKILFEALNGDYYLDCKKILESYGFVADDKRIDALMYKATKIA